MLNPSSNDRIYSCYWPALERHSAPLWHVLGPRPLDPRLELLQRVPSLQGGGVRQGQLQVPLLDLLHLKVHSMADLGQGVDAALVPPAVQELSLGDDQSPVVRINLWSEVRNSIWSLKGLSVGFKVLSQAIILPGFHLL